MSLLDGRILSYRHNCSFLILNQHAPTMKLIQFWFLDAPTITLYAFLAFSYIVYHA